MHLSITADRVEEAVNESMDGTGHPGFCHACGADADNVEPDARKYRCDECDVLEVYGAEETALMM